jgi:hypothetical protein
MIIVSFSGIDDAGLKKLETCINARKNKEVQVKYDPYPIDSVEVGVRLEDRENITCSPEELLERIKEIVDDVATPYRPASCRVGNCSSNFCSWSKAAISKPPPDSTDRLLI